MQEPHTPTQRFPSLDDASFRRIGGHQLRQKNSHRVVEILVWGTSRKGVEATPGKPFEFIAPNCTQILRKRCEVSD
jgi:hypothetical protein